MPTPFLAFRQTSFIKSVAKVLHFIYYLQTFWKFYLFFCKWVTKLSLSKASASKIHHFPKEKHNNGRFLWQHRQLKLVVIELHDNQNNHSSFLTLTSTSYYLKVSSFAFTPLQRRRLFFVEHPFNFFNLHLPLLRDYSCFI